MTDASPLQLLPYAQDSPLLDDALRVYERVWPGRAPAVAREAFTRYAGYLDFRGFVAVVGNDIVGVGYGARSCPGIPWHDLVSPRLGDDHPALRDAWRLVELAVVAEYRRRGVGGTLHDALLVAQPCPRCVLSTAADNQRARTLYERRGWRYVHTDFEVPGESQRYVIMGKELADRTSQ